MTSDSLLYVSPVLPLSTPASMTIYVDWAFKLIDLRHRPTESLILPNKRRFLPFRIPNFHTQLRHYISTADPDRIYVVVDRIVYAIHIAAQKRESIAVIPFEPRCLAAGHGWIAVGGPDNGECAYIRIDERGLQVHEGTSTPLPSDVDAALPLDLDPPSRVPSPGTPSSGSTWAHRMGRRPLPSLVVHKFGGSIVNSVTVHRFPGNGENTSHEDVMVLSNNDRTVTVYSLTRSKVLKIIQHSTCMNYATVSPDLTLLAAVGDENRVYFYRILQDWGSSVATEAGEKLARWEWEMLQCIEMDIGMLKDDACCFTIAFSPSSHLCAIGSQSGVVTVLDVEAIRSTEKHADTDESPILHQFLASRPAHQGGAVRCMTFSPEPWDLLVWLEGHGRAGIADVRQLFLRRQILHLDVEDSALEHAHLELDEDDSDGHPMDDDDPFLPAPPVPRLRIHGDDSPNERAAGEADRSSLGNLTARDIAVMEYLNTARWNAGRDGSPRARSSLHSQPSSRPRHSDGAPRSSRPTPPPHTIDPDLVIDGGDDLFVPPPPPPPPRLSHAARSSTSGRSYHARRQSSVVLSQGRSSGDRQPEVSLSWSASPPELESLGSDNTRGADPDLISHEDSSGPRPPETIGTGPILDLGIRSDNTGTIRYPLGSRRNERPPNASVTERRYNTSHLSSLEIRANLAAERMRRQRQPLMGQRQTTSGLHNRSHEREQWHRQSLLGFDHAHSPRWIRNIINELPDRSVHGSGAEEPDATAGVGWGADGRTLYIATVEGVFEYQLNIHDRRTFPSFSYR